MKVEKVFVNTYKYDFHFARICIASIRYWYPDIPIFLIKDEKQGTFDTSKTEQIWNVKVLETERRKFGWGYGKLEVLFLDNNEAFLVIDADAVLTGPVIEAVAKIEADFIVDREEQPAKRFNEIYYNLNRINELDNNFTYPGYSFNSGQWFGTPSIIKREDFDKTLTWSEPPVTRDKNIVVNNDQGHLNYVIHALEQHKRLSVARIELMVWPVEGKSDFIKIEKIKSRSPDYPFVIHWAGMSASKFSELPRQDILMFYRSYYYSKTSAVHPVSDAMISIYNKLERKVANFIHRSL